MAETGLSLNYTHITTLLAKAYLLAGQVDCSLSTINQTLAFIDQSGEEFWHSYIKIIHGDIFYQLGQRILLRDRCHRKSETHSITHTKNQ